VQLGLTRGGAKHKAEGATDAQSDEAAQARVQMPHRHSAPVPHSALVSHANSQ
jgi:hypothetical protein